MKATVKGKVVKKSANIFAGDMSDESLDDDVPKKSGRRRKGAGPSFPREELDRLLVHGELAEKPDGSGAYTVYPSYRDLAERFGVAHSLVANYAKQHNCLRRRERIEERVREVLDSKLIEARAEVLAMEREEQIRIIDRYLIRFEEAVVEGRVRTDNPSDFNTMCRLKAFLEGDADSRQQMLNGLPTLEEIQEGHKRLLEMERNSTPEKSGESPLWNYNTTPVKEERIDEDDDEENPRVPPARGIRFGIGIAGAWIGGLPVGRASSC